MLSASDGHRAGHAEGSGLRVEDLGGVLTIRRETVTSSGDEDPAVGEQRGGVTAARLTHRDGRVEGAGFRLVDLGGRKTRRSIAADASGDEDATVGEQGCSCARPRFAHRSSRTEGTGRGVIQLSRGERAVEDPARLAPCDENPAVGEPGGDLPVTRGRHRSGGPERAGRRVEQLCRGEHARAAKAPGDEDVAVGEQGRGLERSGRGHRAGRAETATGRVIQLG